MSHDPPGAEIDRDRIRPAAAMTDARSGWTGFLGGGAILAAAVVIAAALWHLFGNRVPALTRVELTETEDLLDQLGFPPGPVDGVIDAPSRSAIRDFQVTAGLRIDGKPSVALLDELRATKAELSAQ
jgi:hypothetical protein